MDKLTYIFDIDGTICNNTYGDYENAKPIQSRVDKVNSLYDEGHTIFFLTARGMGRSDNSAIFAHRILFDFTEKQLESWNVKFHRLFLGKPAGDHYVDDKGVKDTDFFNDKRH